MSRPGGRVSAAAHLPRCLLKVDLQKAFDSVQWSFLERLLKALRFPHIFVTWILACVASVSFRLQFNGHTHPPFPGRQGLRQGDPLSPILFVLTMEYFSRILKKLSGHPDFSFHPHCKALRLTHLMFADDLIIFCKANEASLSLLQEALHTFHATTGLCANDTKSQLILGGVSEPLLSKCLDIMGMPLGQLPIRYLGVPITSGRLTKLQCSVLVDKITARLTTWASRHLSFAGRAALVNSVLFGIFNYWASIFLLPQTVTSRITTLCRHFLWGKTEDHRGPPRSRGRRYVRGNSLVDWASKTSRPGTMPLLLRLSGR